MKCVSRSKNRPRAERTDTGFLRGLSVLKHLTLEISYGSA